MSKYNLVIDVAECTNCNLCTLATMDEYVGNEWPGVSASMPRNGHRWMRVETKERGQAPIFATCACAFVRIEPLSGAYPAPGPLFGAHVPRKYVR